jgi:hypothetical protein
LDRKTGNVDFDGCDFHCVRDKSSPVGIDPVTNSKIAERSGAVKISSLKPSKSTLPDRAGFVSDAMEIADHSAARESTACDTFLNSLCSNGTWFPLLLMTYGIEDLA